MQLDPLNLKNNLALVYRNARRLKLLSNSLGKPWTWTPISHLRISIFQSHIRTWANTVMGLGCLVNAARCGRLHCYVTGPLYLAAALYVVLSAFGLVVVLHPGLFLIVLLAAVVPCPMCGDSLGHVPEERVGRTSKPCSVELGMLHLRLTFIHLSRLPSTPSDDPEVGLRSIGQH